jgi:cytoskeletal protein RodZ
MDQVKVKVEAAKELGGRLKGAREARALTLADIAKVTKIPERSISSLEDGRFTELPAEVFVRGFLKSYSRAVGLDADEIVRAYEDARRAEKPKAAPLPSLARFNQAAAPEPPPSADPPKEAPPSLLRQISEAGKGSRVPLTLAVIVLVIVATLALSLLLRRPSKAGDGVSFQDQNGRPVSSELV